MSLLERFIDPAVCSLKICGVTRRDDALRLASLGVEALGANFWPSSKRYLEPAAAGWLAEMRGAILRVGVFVNAPLEQPLQFLEEGLIDAIQLHGDETPATVRIYQQAGVPFFKAIGVRTQADLAHAADFHAAAVLLDAHAPGVYGGTGATFDWHDAVDFKSRHPEIPVILAGGITPENAALAVRTVRPAALDVASGAEVSPGVKDFAKVAALLAALHG